MISAPHFSLLLLIASGLVASASAQDLAVSPKKGIGMVANENHPGWYERVDSLNVAWHYGWGIGPTDPSPPDNAIWAPMKWSGSDLSTDERRYLLRGKANGSLDRLLGFNEPDGEDQANITVARALEVWPQLESIGLPLGSPATVNSLNSWMKEFMAAVEQQDLRVDFVCLHRYGGDSVDGLIDQVTKTYNEYGRPVLITEFAVADWSATAERPNRYSPAEVLAFMQDVLPRLEALDYVEGYAWFPASQSSLALGSSALHDPNGVLTPLGEFYANFVGGKWRGLTAAESWSTNNAEMLPLERGSKIHHRTVTLSSPPNSQTFWRAAGVLASTGRLPAEHDTWFQHETATSIDLYLDQNTYADGWLPASDRMYQDPPFIARRYGVTGDFLSELGLSDWALGASTLYLFDSGNQAGDVTADDQIYTVRLSVPVAGDYAFVIVGDNDWNYRFGHLGATGDVSANDTPFTVTFDDQVVTFHLNIANNTVRVTPRTGAASAVLDVLSGPGQPIAATAESSAQDLADQLDMDSDNDLDACDVAQLAVYMKLAQ